MSDDRRDDGPPAPPGAAPDPWGAVLQAALGALPCPPLPAALSERVARLAHAHLAPPPDQAAPALGFRLREALVPALLMSAVVVRTNDTMQVVRHVFAEQSDPGDGKDDGGEPG